MVRALEPCRAPSPRTELEGLREKAGIHLLPHSLLDAHHSDNCWLNRPTNGCSLTAGYLWEGPTVAPANG